MMISGRILYGNISFAEDSSKTSVLLTLVLKVRLLFFELIKNYVFFLLAET